MGKRQRLVPLPVGRAKRHGIVQVPETVKYDPAAALAAILETYGDAVNQAREYVQRYERDLGALPDWTAVTFGPDIQGTPEYYVSALNALGHECKLALDARDLPRAAKARDALCAMWGCALERGALNADQRRGEKTITAAASGGEARRKTAVSPAAVHAEHERQLRDNPQKGRAIKATAAVFNISRRTVYNRLNEWVAARDTK